MQIRNAGARDRYVTVVVSRDGDTVFAKAKKAPVGRDVRFPSVVDQPGIYRVVVETPGGARGTFTWHVRKPLGDLSVRLDGSDVQFTQKAWCDPDCPPLSVGEDGDTPRYVAREWSGFGATLRVENRAERTRRARVELFRGGDRLVDQVYEVPPGVQLVFPSVRATGDYRVVVRTERETARYDWNVRTERRLTATITDAGVEVGCGTETGDLRLVNDDDSLHQIRVRVRRDGPIFTDSYVLSPGERRSEHAIVTGSGRYTLYVETAGGAATTSDWWLCPPRGPTEITVEPDGSLSVVQHAPG